MSPRNDVRTALLDHAVVLPTDSATADGVDVAASDEDVERSAACLDTPDTSNGLENPQIVGLGEATHGTRECFEHKARLVQNLVVEGGFRTVAFEADAAAATALDAFVRDGDAFVGAPADAKSALAELDMWQWQTEAVGDLLTWIREFNAGRASEEQVRVRGVDLSTPAAPAAPLRAFFERVDPGVVDSEPFRTVADATVPEDDDERERALDAVAAAADTLAERLKRNRASYETTTSEAAWTEVRHRCRVVEQAVEWARVRHEQPGPHPEGMATRDRFMAENALWALEQDTGDGVALWAHDGHVQRGTFDDGTLWTDTTTMGERLARELVDGYRPVGFDFGRGSFRAVGAGSGEIETFTVGEPATDSATATFSAVEEGPYVLDLRAAADDDRLSSWLAGERRKRYVGSVFDPADDEAASAETDLAASFDCLLFLPESSPSRPVVDRSRNS